MDRENKERPLCTGLGEILFDCLPGGERLGGAPVNFAYSAKALGLRAAAVSAVGRDERGDRARRLLAEKGIAAHLAETDRETGRVDVLLDTGGVPSYHFLPEPAYGSIPWTEALARLAEETDICCFGTLAQWGEVSRRTVRRFLASMRPAALRVFDVNLRGTFYTEEIIRGSLRCADAVKCSEEELERLASAAGCGGAGPDDLAAFLRGMGICKLIYTKGEKGSLVWWDGKRSEMASPKTDVADTVGAGDAFTAALTAAMACGWSLREAHRLAAETAAYVCSREGAMPEYPPRLAGRLGRAE